MFAKIVFLCLVLSALAQRLPYDYHGRVGIKKAGELRASEGLGISNRIVGGTEVPQDAHIPHQAGIIVVLTSGWTSICGGSLVSTTRVLTAAHCWNDGRSQARQFTVVLGSTTLFTGGTRLVTSTVNIHPNWNSENLTHDIAMVILPVPREPLLNNNIQLVRLPTMVDMDRDFAGMSAIVSGYGKTSDSQNSFPITTSLHQTTVNIITNGQCQPSFLFNLHAGHLCTSGSHGVGTCDGDSGGPLTVVHNNARTLVGIVSFGPQNGCQSGLPSVYTRVTAFLGWIEANL